MRLWILIGLVLVLALVVATRSSWAVRQRMISQLTERLGSINGIESKSNEELQDMIKSLE